MPKLNFPKGTFKLIFNGDEHLAEYIGRQRGFECTVCGKGENCYTFNIFNSAAEYAEGNYETWGFGAAHIKQLNYYQWEWLEKTVVLHASSEEMAKTAYNKLLEAYPNNTLYESTAGYNSQGTYDAVFWRQQPE